MQRNLYNVKFCFFCQKFKKIKNKKKSKILSWVDLTLPSQNDGGDQNPVNSTTLRVQGVACAGVYLLLLLDNCIINSRNILLFVG